MQPQKILLQSSIASFTSIGSRAEDHGENASPDYVLRTQSQSVPKPQYWIVEEVPQPFDDTMITGRRGSNQSPFRESCTWTSAAVWSVCFFSILAITICLVVMAFLPNDPPSNQQMSMTANSCCAKRFCRGMGFFERCWLEQPQCPCPVQVIAEMNPNNNINSGNNQGGNNGDGGYGRAVIIHSPSYAREQPQQTVVVHHVAQPQPQQMLEQHPQPLQQQPRAYQERNDEGGNPGPEHYAFDYHPPNSKEYPHGSFDEHHNEEEFNHEEPHHSAEAAEE